MNGRDSFKRCRVCGKRIGIITQGIYRKVVVDETPVEVIPDENGDSYIRIDGSKMIGREAEPGEIQMDTEWVYRPNRRSCRMEK